MHIVIIGNGIAGISTARHIRKISDHDITVISAETEYFFSRTALMYVYMGHQKFEHTQPYENWFWEKNNIKLRQQQVSKLHPQNNEIEFADGSRLGYDKLVLATGSEPNKFGWPGQDLNGVQGMYSKQDLDGMEKHSEGLEHAVIVGGGLIGIEMAEMFHSRHIPVTFLVREDSFWNGVMPPEESEMINQEIRDQGGVDLRLKEELKEILADSNGKCRAAITSTGEEIACQFVGLTAGVHPRKELTEGTEIETNRGILVNEYLQTSVPNIYATGDCCELRNPVKGNGRRAIEAVWYTGKLQGPILAKTLCGTDTAWVQGTWFNSAKFFDLEYQVYGYVPNKIEEGQQHLVWQHESGKKLIRINYDAASGAVLGFNLVGIRFRQNVCTKWIEDKTHIEKVLPHLGMANFDPEFFKQHEGDVVAAYNQQNPGANLELKTKKGLAGVFAFLKK